MCKKVPAIPDEARMKTPKKPVEQSFKDKALHALLIEKLPVPYVRTDGITGRKVLDTLRISKALTVSRFTVYRFLNDEKLSKRTASGLVAISDGAIDQADVMPFLMRL